MKVSVITIVKNDPAGLQKTVQSVSSQKYRNIEHIIVDGGSERETVELIKNLSGNFIFLPGPDSGMYDGMNRGVMSAKGEIVSLLHAGDVFSNDYVVARIVNSFVSSGADAVYGDTEFYDKKSGKISRVWKAGVYEKKNLQNQWWIPPHLSLFVKRSVYEKNGYYSLDLSFASDHEWMLRLFLDDSAKIIYLPETLVRMRSGGQNTSSIKNFLHSNLCLIKVLKMHGLSPGITGFVRKMLRKIKQFS
ncbi:MAG TPA: glycosyltransferase family 2 protein [bacterium]|nr:glycosyltransferase family 2 protein [bacterium]HPS29081.1 glycosyltransferase family 2 protein [bacterium]